MRHVSRVSLLILSASLLAGCGGGGPPASSRRTTRSPFPASASQCWSTRPTSRSTRPPRRVPMSLPAAAANEAWAQSGGNASKSVGHVALGQSLGVAWTASIGKGSDKDGRLGGGPVVGEGKVFTMDTTGTVRAFDASNGGQLWSTRFGEVGDNAASIYGGGVAYDVGPGLCHQRPRLCRRARTPPTAAAVWTVKPGGPLRGEPSVAGDAVYVMSQDNQLYSLKTADGTTNWSNAAALEIAGVFGSAAPSIGQGTVVAGFSSGELNAYRYENGRQVWQDALSRTTHDDQRRVAVRHRRRPGDRRRRGLRHRPGRPDGRARPLLRPAHLGAELRRHRDAVGRGRLAVRGQRQGASWSRSAAPTARSAGSTSCRATATRRRQAGRSPMSARCWPATG